MRNLIRKIIKEQTLEVEVELPREERIKIIQHNYSEVEKMLPTIIEFIKTQMREKISKIIVSKKKIFYGMDDYSTETFVLNIIMKSVFPERTKGRLFRDIRDYTGIDPGLYGVPLDIEFHLNENAYKLKKGNAREHKLNESPREILKLRRRMSMFENELLMTMRVLYTRKAICSYSKEEWEELVFDKLFEDFEDYEKSSNLTKEESEQIKKFIHSSFRHLVIEFWETRCNEKV